MANRPPATPATVTAPRIEPNPFFPDLTVTTRTPTPTVRDYFNIDSMNAGQLLRALSDGEFDPKYLKRYRHKERLRSACLEALREFADELF